MKNINDILNENFFGNLGIGKKAQIEKWFEDNKEDIYDYRYGIYKINDDGKITLDNLKTNISAIFSDSFVGARKKPLLVPKIISFKEFTYPNREPLWLSKLNFEDITTSNLDKIKANDLKVTECEYTSKEINYLLSNKNFKTILFHSVRILDDDFVINCNNKNLQTLNCQISNILPLNIKFNCNLSPKAVIKFNGIDVNKISGSVKGCKKLFLKNVRLDSFYPEYGNIENIDITLLDNIFNVFKDIEILYINNIRLEKDKKNNWKQIK